MEWALGHAELHGRSLYTQLVEVQAELYGNQAFLIKRDSQSVVLSVSAGEEALWPRISMTAEQPHWHHRCLHCKSYNCRHCQHLQQVLGALEDEGDVIDGLEECSFRPQGWAPPSQPASNSVPTPMRAIKIDPDHRSPLIASRNSGRLGRFHMSCPAEANAFKTQLYLLHVDTCSAIAAGGLLPPCAGCAASRRACDHCIPPVKPTEPAHPCCPDCSSPWSDGCPVQRGWIDSSGAKLFGMSASMVVTVYFRACSNG
jgi:hypothetical protein